MGTFAGKTQDAGSEILGAKFWGKKGTKIDGAIVLRVFDTVNGPCYELKLASPITVNGEKLSKASIGNMKGFTMALAAAGVPNSELRPGDVVTIESTGTTDTGKGSERVDFNVLVHRR